MKDFLTGIKRNFPNNWCLKIGGFFELTTVSKSEFAEPIEIKTDLHLEKLSVI